MWLPLIFFALATTVGSDAELANRRDEDLLLHQRVPLAHLRVWDRASADFREPLPQERPAGTVLIVHLWADYCKPCIEEFPWLKTISARMGNDSVRFVMLAESPTSAREMQAFLAAHAAQMPAGALYLDTGAALFQELSVRRLPVTLLVDAEGGVRQAFLGSIRERRSELIDAILRLQKFMRQRPEAEPLRASRRGER